MCACRQKKSFLIADILGETKKKPYKNLSNEPSKPLVCNTKAAENVSDGVETESEHKDYEEIIDSTTAYVEKSIPVIAKYPAIDLRSNPSDDKSDERKTIIVDRKPIPVDTKLEDNLTRFNVMSEVQHEIELSKVNLEHRRNTYPLHPTPLKPSYWNYREKGPLGYIEPRAKDSLGFLDPRMTYYSEQILNASQLLRNQLAANRFVSHPYAIRQSYGFDRGSPSCCPAWWGAGARRKGGQVRFTSAQTGALERRFTASKYLSPDERRTLATTLRLSDRQVKTWFQNRRAKWRRTTPDSADPGSPTTSPDGSDDDVQIADDDSIL